MLGAGGQLIKRETLMDQHSKNVLIGISMIVIGLLLLLDSFEVLNFWKAIWPTALIIVGLAIIFKHRINAQVVERENDRGLTASHVMGAVFGDIRIAGLTGGIGTIDRSLVFGDIVIDLNGAELLETVNVINASTMFGDVNIFVPEIFPKKVQLNCCAGSLRFNQKSADGIFPSLKHTDDNYEEAPAKLYIKARTCFGDVQVVSSPK
jgi:predicted membrane protein